MRGMTAYAYAQKKSKKFNVRVVLRSTNSKYLEIFTHQLPPDKIYLENKIGKEIRKKIYRGKVEVYFIFHTRKSQQLVIDKYLLSHYCREVKKVSRLFNISPYMLFNNILTLPGIIRLEEKQDAIDNTLILSAIKEGVKKLVAFREKQGIGIKREVTKNFKEIKKSMEKVENKIATFSFDTNGHKDIAEEISLISFYINKLEKIISSNKRNPCGKAIDFLSQEIQRELNAASSKTKNKSISGWLLEAKNALERIREQAQNIE